MITQINLLPIISFIKKHLGWFIAIVLFIIVLCQSNCSSDHQAEIAIRKKEIKANKKIQDSLFQINKEKDVIIAKSEKIIADSNKKIFKLELDKKAEKLKGDKEIAKVKNYNLRQWQMYYQEIANSTNEQINIQGNTLTFTKEPLVSIANVIIKGQVATKQNTITLEQLAKSQDNEKELNVIVQQEREKNTNSELMLATEKDTSKKWEDSFNKSQTDLNNAKRPKLVPILIGAAVGFGVGATINK